MERFTWDDRVVQIDSFLARRYGWLATREELRIDGELVAAHGGFTFESKSFVALPHKDIFVKVTFVTRVCWTRVLAVKYAFLVDDVLVRDGLAGVGARWTT